VSWSHWDELRAAIAAGQRDDESLREVAEFMDGRLREVSSRNTCRDDSRDSIASAVMGVFGLHKNSSSKVPTVLLVACKRERCAKEIIEGGDGADSCAALHAALKRLAELARERWSPLGLDAQRWGYGEHILVWQQYTVV
jgi:hypothetical protein